MQSTSLVSSSTRSISLKKPSEKWFRIPSSERRNDTEEAMLLKSILEKPEKRDLLDQIHERLKKIETESKELKDTVAQVENGLKSIKKDVEEGKIATEQKADKSKVEALEKGVTEGKTSVVLSARESQRRRSYWLYSEFYINTHGFGSALRRGRKRASTPNTNKATGRY